MILTTMIYLSVISTIAGAAAWVAESGLRRAGLPIRWVWLAAMLLGPALLTAGALLPPESTARLAAAPTGPVIELPAFEVASSDSAPLGPNEGLLLAWVLASGLMVAAVLRTRLVLARERRRWQEARVDGRRVLIAADRGPAVTGVLRPRIVLPRWFEELAGGHRAFVLLHEEEHVKGGDTILLPIALALVSFTPWNPCTWLQFRRLRGAMELDCDRRVLKRRPDPSSYGESLIRVAARASGASLGLAAFSERPGAAALERRIVAMTHRRTRWGSFRAVMLTTIAAAIAAQACGVEDPMTIDERGAVTVDPRQTIVPDDPNATLPPPPIETRSAEEIRREPTFTPFTVAPGITNREEVIRVLREQYPPLLREAGVGGTVRVYFFVNERGLVEQVRLDRSSGHPALDEAALNVAGAYQFTAARNGDDPVPVWVSFPITFQVR
jgi:TonB family protein